MSKISDENLLETYKSTIRRIKEKNTRCFLEGVSLDHIDGKKYFFHIGHNELAIKLAYALDRIIVVKNKNLFHLYRIYEIHNNSCYVTLLTNVFVKKIFTEKDLSFCDFEIEIPLIVLKDQFLFPFEVNSFIIGRENSINSLNLAIENGSHVFLTKQKEEFENKDEVAFYDVGTLASFEEVKQIDQASCKVAFIGIYRCKVRKVREIKGIYTCLVDIFYEIYENIDFYYYQKNYFLKLNQIKKISGYFDFSNDTINSIIETEDIYTFVFLVLNFSFDTQRRNDFIGKSIEQLLDIIVLDISQKFKYAEMEIAIDQNVKDSINGKNKKMWIEEKIKALKKKLNEFEPSDDDNMSTKGYEDPSQYPDEVKKILKEEKAKLGTANSHDNYIIQQHIDHIYKLPWYTCKPVNKNIHQIRQLLQESHRSSDDLIDQFIESLNIRDLENSGNVIFLLGPPGVGKSTFAEAIAKAMKVPFSIISCAGISDSSILTGHSRTYVGATPGRIVTTLQNAKAKNPVILLDEIDKINDGSGKNPRNVLFQILDKNLNNRFKDSYIEPEIDLSKVLWIVTANSLKEMPEAIIDRSRVFYMEGYSISEKIPIAPVMIEKIIKIRKTTADEIKFSDEAILYLITTYTYESGVRKLYEKLDKIIANILIRIDEIKNRLQDPNYKISSRNVDDNDELGRMIHLKQEPIVITKNMLDNLLQYERKNEEMINQPGIGRVFGLAYTTMGGTITPIEVITITNNNPNRPVIEFTGNVEKVMQESLKVALAFIRSNASEFGIESDFFDKNIIHVHALNGAVNKDGPSAGGAFFIATISRILNKSIRKNTCLTGEISLNGEIMPIGGISQKLQAAEREGLLTNQIFTVYVPRANKKDVEKVKNSLRNVEVVFVDKAKHLLAMLEK